MTYDGLVNARDGFRLEAHDSADGLVVAVFGRLNSEHAAYFREELRKKIPGQKLVVVDLNGVPMMDSSGLGSLASLYISARTKGCQLRVINATDQVRKLFSISNMLLLFEDVGKHRGPMI